METSDYEVIGVMSGTSLDGVDLCHIKFTKNDGWSFHILHAETVKYTDSWKEKLRESSELNQGELIQLNLEYTDLLSEIISAFISKYKIIKPDAICSHGHTVLHQPENGISLQIGNLRGLASKIGYRTICDFRVQDVELGGQGAPLVPIGDRLLFSGYDICLNLGGFANLSYEHNKSRVAFDICPANIVLNQLANHLGYEYDNGGSLARSGKLIPELLQKLNSLNYYQIKGPKSLGVEWVKSEFIPLLKGHESTRDLLHTVSIHIAHQISRTINKLQKGSVLVSGGGAFNKFIIESIQKNTQHTIEIPDKRVIEFKEALIFGLLGVLRLRNEINCLGSVTGASKDHSSGKIFDP